MNWRSRAVLIILFTSLVAAATGCASDSSDEILPPPAVATTRSATPPSPSPTVDPEHAAIFAATAHWVTEWSGGGQGGEITSTQVSTTSIRINEVQVLVTHE